MSTKRMKRKKRSEDPSLKLQKQGPDIYDTRRINLGDADTEKEQKQGPKIYGAIKINLGGINTETEEALYRTEKLHELNLIEHLKVSDPKLKLHKQGPDIYDAVQTNPRGSGRG